MSSIGFGAMQGMESILEDLYKKQLEKTRAAEAQRAFDMQRERLGLDRERLAAEQADRLAGYAMQGTQIAQRQNEFDADQDQWRSEQKYRATRDAASDKNYLRKQSFEEQQHADDQAFRAANFAMQGTTMANTNAQNEAQRAMNLRIAELNNAPDQPQGGGSKPMESEGSSRGGRIISAIDDLLKDTDYSTVGMANLSAGLPMAPARYYASRLNSLKGNIALEELAALRAMAKSGASGLGQVTEKEIAILENALGALDQGLTPEQMRKQLGIVRAQAEKIQMMLQGGGVPSAGISVGAAKAGMGAPQPSDALGGLRNRFNY